jgi:hypothetical protein
MHIAKLKDGPKKAIKVCQTILERVLKMVWWRGGGVDSRKKILRLRYFSPLKILTSPFYLQRLLELLFFSISSFFHTFSLRLFFSMLHLFEDLGILMVNEEKNTLQKFLFRWNGMAKPWFWKLGSCGMKEQAPLGKPFYRGGQSFSIMHQSGGGWAKEVVSGEESGKRGSRWPSSKALASTLPQPSSSTSSCSPRAQTTDQKHQKQGNFPSFFSKVPLFYFILNFLILWHAMMENKDMLWKKSK